ncbi:MAG: PIF1 family ATP-dependent DNA helicase, partial [Gemmatimonadales bacterium]
RSGTGPSIRRREWQLRGVLAAATVLVVDECSMLSEQLFNDADSQARSARQCRSRPFGGLQVLMLGDFLQLPPVGDRATADGRFCFASPVFDQLFAGRMFRLTQQMRQGDDACFASVLSRIRRGECPADVLALLRTRLVSAAAAPSARHVTHLFCLRRDAEACNAASLAELPFTSRQWRALDWFASEECRRVANTLPLEPEIELKTGAPVLLVRNIDLTRRLVNGTRGVVCGVHTLCELGIGPRCGDPETCDVCAERSSPISEHLELLGDQPPRGWTGHLPVVDFGGEGRRFIVGTVTVEKKRPAKRKSTATTLKRKAAALEAASASVSSGQKLASRTQLPLMLAFGLTVHKAQGMTLERVCLALNRAFDPGQVYVGLSRCPKLKDVYLVSSYVPTERIRASPEALLFERTKMREPALAQSTAVAAASSSSDGTK